MICCSNCFSWITNIYILDFFMLTIIIQIYKENTMAPRKSASKTKSSSKPKSAAAKAAAKKRASKSRSSSRSRSTASRSRSRSTSRSLGYGPYGTECAPGYQRSAITGACTKIPCFDSAGNMIPYATRNKYGECQLPRCGKNTVLNPETGRCISRS